jgi:hypothetical protein
MEKHWLHADTLMKKIIRGLLAALMLAPASLTARAATTIDPSDPGIYYSPGCWHVVKGSATEVTNGCYFKANLLDTSTVALNFNVAQQYVYANNFTQLWWRIDGAAGTWTTVSLTTSTPTVKLAIPATTNAPGWKQHMLEVVVKNSASAGNRWNPADPRREWAAVILTGITVDTGASAALPYVAPRKILVMGDSVTEGFSNACTGTACNAAGITSIEDARMSYAWVLLRDLGAEGSLIGFAGQSWDGPSPNSAPPFTASYNFLYQGVPRSFAGIDMVVINQGSNGGPSGADVPNVLNGMVAAGLTGIAVVICPFRTDTCAAEKSALANGVAAARNPSRFFFVDTSRIVQPPNCRVDIVHPYGWCHVNYLGPQLAALLAPYLYSAQSPRR